MATLKLLFLINGSKASAAGIRAEMFAANLPKSWEIRFNYRPTSKWKGILPFIQSAIRFQPDIIYVMDTAYTGVLAGCIAKKMLRCKLITDTGDIAFELAKSTGRYSAKQLALIHWIEQLAINQSDALVVRGSYHKLWLEQQGIYSATFVPDGVDTSVVKPMDATTSKAELGLDKSLVVGLVGTMAWSEQHQMCYGWDVVEALGMLQDVPINALLVGDGDGRIILEQRVCELEISDRVQFIGQVSYNDLPRYLSAMDVCISTQSNDLVGMVRTTGKLPLYLAYGKYVVATDVGEAKRVLPGLGCLLPYEGVRDDNHPARLATHLRNLVLNRQGIEVSEKAQQTAKTHFDYVLLTQRIEQICRSLVSI